MENNCDLNTDQINRDYHFGLNHVVLTSNVLAFSTSKGDILKMKTGKSWRRTV